MISGLFSSQMVFVWCRKWQESANVKVTTVALLQNIPEISPLESHRIKLALFSRSRRGTPFLFLFFACSFYLYIGFFFSVSPKKKKKKKKIKMGKFRVGRARKTGFFFVALFQKVLFLFCAIVLLQDHMSCQYFQCHFSSVVFKSIDNSFRSKTWNFEFYFLDVLLLSPQLNHMIRFLFLFVRHKRQKDDSFSINNNSWHNVGHNRQKENISCLADITIYVKNFVCVVNMEILIWNC